MIKKIPKFVDGNIITKEMLMALSEFAFATPNLTYQGYSDGIVSGLQLKESKGKILVGKGIVKLEEQLLFIDEQEEITYLPTNKTTYLILCYKGAKETKGSVNHEYTIELKEEGALKNEIELCRYQLQEGARLRWRYDDFEDLRTEYNTINLIHSPYASKDNETLHLEVLKNFAREMLVLGLEDMEDLAFCFYVLGSNKGINKEAIIAYIALKTNEELEVLAIDEMYQKLLHIWEDEKRIIKKEKPKKRNETQKIWIN